VLKRLVSAAVLIPLVVWSVLVLPTPLLAGVLGLVVLAGSLEWTRLIPCAAVTGRISYLVLVSLALLAAWWLQHRPGAVAGVLGAVVLAWVVALAWVLRPGLGSAGGPGWRWAKGSAGLVFLAAAWLALMVLHQRQEGPQLMLFLLVLIWCADSGAYLAGRQWGRRKLAPAVSPGKTWEGVVGGLVLAGAFSVLGGWLLGWRGPALVKFSGLCLITVSFSVLGDLYESLLKRQAGVKDSGNLIPGHGGVLDRVDSLLAAAPVFVVGLHLLDL
jgi:phosphatidate cytidylyltransferase